jgi:hypothetical protein
VWSQLDGVAAELVGARGADPVRDLCRTKALAIQHQVHVIKARRRQRPLRVVQQKVKARPARRVDELSAGGTRVLQYHGMARIVVEMSGEPWATFGDEEAELVGALAEVAHEHEVFRAEAFRAAREAEAGSLSERLPAMPPADREQAVARFEARHGPFGHDAFRLRVQVKRLEAESAASALLARLPQLSPAERVAAVEEYGRQYSRLSDEFQRLHQRLAEVDPATAEAVPPEIVAPFGYFDEVLTIAIPAISGALANRVLDVAIEWVRQRATRTQSAQTVRLYGPEGEVIREVHVSSTGSTHEG